VLMLAIALVALSAGFVLGWATHGALKVRS
jgi:hypothetical protein